MLQLLLSQSLPLATLHLFPGHSQIKSGYLWEERTNDHLCSCKRTVLLAVLTSDAATVLFIFRDSSGKHFHPALLCVLSFPGSEELLAFPVVSAALQPVFNSNKKASHICSLSNVSSLPAPLQSSAFSASHHTPLCCAFWLSDRHQDRCEVSPDGLVCESSSALTPIDHKIPAVTGEVLVDW